MFCLALYFSNKHLCSYLPCEFLLGNFNKAINLAPDEITYVKDDLLLPADRLSVLLFPGDL